MASVRFLPPGEVSKKNKKYVNKRRIWQIISVIEGLVIIYLLYFKH